ncbi:uncharacterized protein LOC112511450 isoform X2 [Cynara cardunculus var. scolymus]|uniref:uncharacterized protein LOC112511450 isoform X2 n=1 Tax=Cynara cardunculus var. scolymus TaxID=59895 RepID=UPI000D62FC84|nr:uncharacterized protein LOC112511450 isoform X2 [Cynara cardunculus var. scolymus]
MYGSSGCLGCDAKHKLMKGQESQIRSASRPSMAEGVLTSSRLDVDNSAVHSLGTISSIDTPNPTLDSHGIGDPSQDFINHGFLFWNQSRQQWVGNKGKSNQGDQLRESRLSWNETYVSLLGSNKPFAMPVPLSEMVDFLVDVWEQEGMYD